MLAGLFLIVSPALSQSLFAEGRTGPTRWNAMARSAIRIIGAILLPGLVVILAVGGTLLSAFGPAYAHHGVGLLRIAVLASIPDAVTNVYVGGSSCPREAHRRGIAESRHGPRYLGDVVASPAR